VGVEEFGCEIGEGLVVQLKLALERPVRDAATLAEERQDLIEHGIEVHYCSSFINLLVTTAIPLVLLATKGMTEQAVWRRLYSPRHTATEQLRPKTLMAYTILHDCHRGRG
jgi:hypothetical protein